MNDKDIKQINSECTSDYPAMEGIFTQPNYIPITVKEPVIYRARQTGGVSGGSCWESSDPQPFTIEFKEENWSALDLVLEKLMPDIKYLQYKKIQKLIHSNTEIENEYYGNSRDYLVEYIILSELEDMIKTFKK